VGLAVCTALHAFSPPTEDDDMGAVETAVDAAASFVGPFVDTAPGHGVGGSPATVEAADVVVAQALDHLLAINAADLAADPNAPYDASLAGVVYALLDLITSVGVLPHLTPGVAFSQRPRSVLAGTPPLPSSPCEALLAKVIHAVIPVLRQPGSGVQPLLSQRILPDVICALADLSFAPQTTEQTRSESEPLYYQVLSTTPTSRLLPVLTTLLQQTLPVWLKPHVARELTLIPLRPQGIRHVIEFLSLSALSNNSEVPKQANGSPSQAPIPLEAIAQAAKLLALPPTDMHQDVWIRKLEPQLWTLLDGSDGRELSRAAGHIIAAGFLSKKATGAPGAVGWQLFAQPLMQSISPNDMSSGTPRKNTKDQVLVQEGQLLLTMKRLSAITSAHSHAGLIKRLLGPLLLPLWALLNFAKARRLVNKEWIDLPQAILSRYTAIVCHPEQIDLVTRNLFWDGPASWCFGAGSHGGIEIRPRKTKESGGTTGIGDVDNILSRIRNLDERVQLFISILATASVSDDSVGNVFVRVTKRWLAPVENSKTSLTNEPDTDPLAALADAKLSEALASKFQANFARCPQHIVEFMCQLLQNYVAEHKKKSENLAALQTPSRASLKAIIEHGSTSGVGDSSEDTTADDLVSFATSILNTIIISPEFQWSSAAGALLSTLMSPLQYLSRPHKQLPISSIVSNSATSLLQLVGPTQQHHQHSSTHTTDPLMEHRATLKTILPDLTNPEPPNRTWALNSLRKLIQSRDAFPVIDVPSTTHLLLSASLSDDESYVHTAAVPVLVDLAARAANPVVRVLVDAFVDVEERSLKLAKGKRTEEKDKELLGALDFRLRVGEVLSKFSADDAFWRGDSDVGVKYASLRRIVEACLSLASRRGQRHQTLEARQSILFLDAQQQEEAEAAWGGPIPNLLGSEAEYSETEDKEREALLRVVKGWEETGVEEDVRVRASAMSVLGTVLEERLDMVSQVSIDASLQTVLLVMTVETSSPKSILRRAAVLVVMGMLRAMDSRLEAGQQQGSSIGLGHTQQEEVERVMRWARDEDADALVREHAASVVEGLETLEMKKLYRIRDEGLRLGADLGLEGPLRGLDMQARGQERQGQARLMVEEIE
jgi:hypothetical protein